MLKEQLLRNYILSELFNATTEDDFIKIGQGVFTIGGVPLTATQSSEIIQEAKLLKENRFFVSLLKELEYDAQKRIFKDSTDFSGVEAPKWLLYAVDLLRRKVEHCSSLQVKQTKNEQDSKKKKGV